MSASLNRTSARFCFSVGTLKKLFLAHRCRKIAGRAQFNEELDWVDKRSSDLEESHREKTWMSCLAATAHKLNTPDVAQARAAVTFADGRLASEKRHVST